jgi:YD repeat-containing protein
MVPRWTHVLTSVTDRDGRVRTFGYDNAGRQTSEVWRDGSNNAIRTISYTYDAAGNLATLMCQYGEMVTATTREAFS